MRFKKVSPKKPDWVHDTLARHPAATASLHHPKHPCQWLLPQVMFSTQQVTNMAENWELSLEGGLFDIHEKCTGFMIGQKLRQKSPKPDSFIGAAGDTGGVCRGCGSAWLQSDKLGKSWRSINLDSPIFFNKFFFLP